MKSSRPGRVTRYFYDNSSDHLLETEYFDKRKSRYSYEDPLHPHSLTDVSSACCAERRFSYDPQGRLSAIHNATTPERARPHGIARHTCRARIETGANPTPIDFNAASPGIRRARIEKIVPL